MVQPEFVMHAIHASAQHMCKFVIAIVWPRSPGDGPIFADVGANAYFIILHHINECLVLAQMGLGSATHFSRGLDYLDAFPVCLQLVSKTLDLLHALCV